MSRDKFEARYKYLNLAMLDETQYVDELTQIKYEGWLAGRESMRDEAIKKADNLWYGEASFLDGDVAVKRLIEKIQEIEP